MHGELKKSVKVLTFLNEKGGVGKTTMAATIAAGLAIKGYRVLMIDADPQGHLSIAFGAKKQHSLYDLLVRDAEFNEAGIVYQISPSVYLPAGMQSNGKLFLVPGNRETRLIAQALDSEPMAVRDKMNELRSADVVDVVVFDTSPTPSALHALIFLATHYIIHPTETTFLSLDGLKASHESVKSYSAKKKELGLEPIELIGIIPTKFRPKTLEHQEKFTMLREAFKEYVWHPMPQSVVWEEAMARRLSIFSYVPDHPVVLDAWKVVEMTERKIFNV